MEVQQRTFSSSNAYLQMRDLLASFYIIVCTITVPSTNNTPISLHHSSAHYPPIYLFSFSSNPSSKYSNSNPQCIEWNITSQWRIQRPNPQLITSHLFSIHHAQALTTSFLLVFFTFSLTGRIHSYPQSDINAYPAKTRLPLYAARFLKPSYL